MFEIRRFTFVCLSAAITLLAGIMPAVGAGKGARITDYPTEVPFGSTIEITGHAAEGSTGSVKLLRRFPHDDYWRKLQSATPDSSGTVSFLLERARYTGEYKLSSAAGDSDSVRIGVKPRLTLRLKRADVMSGRKAIVRGSFRPTWSGRQALLKIRSEGQWATIDELRLADGRFRRELRVDDAGRHRLRVVFDRDVRNTYTRATETLRAHRKDMATWYGPGFFGNRTACGKRYRRDLLGVAHRTLPCGTKVSVLYRGRSVKVPVVDRGPYGHANWDLTEETAQRLRFSGRQTVGVLH